jgi:hypothetical protein
MTTFWRLAARLHLLRAIYCKCKAVNRVDNQAQFIEKHHFLPLECSPAIIYMNNGPVRNVHTIGTERKNGVGDLNKWAEWNLHCHRLDGQLNSFLVGSLHNVLCNVRFLHCSGEDGNASDSLRPVKCSCTLRQAPDAILADSVCDPYALQVSNPLPATMGTHRRARKQLTSPVPMNRSRTANVQNYTTIWFLFQHLSDCNSGYHGRRDCVNS